MLGIEFMVQNKYQIKRSFVLILSIILIISSCILLTSCDDKDANDYTNPNNAGKLLKIFDENGNITGYQRTGFNTKGQLQRLDVYDINENLQYFKTFAYDTDGNLSQETWYKANGIGDYYYTYKYDENKNLIEKGYYPAKGNIEIILYDSNGIETDKYIYDEDKLLNHFIFKKGEWVTTNDSEQHNE